MLYWIPFLEALKLQGIDPARLIPISRGGAAAWYGTQTGLELYAMRSVRDVRIANKLQHKQTGMLKQNRITAFDREVLRDAAQTLGLTDYHVLHPSWMYETLAPFWEATRGLLWLQQHLAWGPLSVPPVPDSVTLPEHFACARFYFRSTFSRSDMTQRVAVATIQRMTAHGPVIVLHHDEHVDDHTDLAISKLPNVTMLRDLIQTRPETNLAVQSAILARSDAFVGTYGGFAQLALRLQRPVVSYFDQWGGTAMAHKHLSDALALLTGIPCQVYGMHELALASAALPIVTLNRPSIETQSSPVQVA